MSKDLNMVGTANASASENYQKKRVRFWGLKKRTI